MIRADLKRAACSRNRLLLKRARDDRREWMVKRRERIRQLIELGGLIVKAGLIELTEDDRAVIFGLLAEAAAKVRSDDGEQQLVLWRRRGRKEFGAPTEVGTGDNHVMRNSLEKASDPRDAQGERSE